MKYFILAVWLGSAAAAVAEPQSRQIPTEEIVIDLNRTAEYQYVFAGALQASTDAAPGQVGMDCDVMGCVGPFGAGSDAKGNIYILDQVNRRIQKYDNKFKFLEVIVEDKKKDVYFGNSLAVDSRGRLLFFARASELWDIEQGKVKRVDISELTKKLHSGKPGEQIFCRIRLFGDEMPWLVCEGGGSNPIVRAHAVYSDAQFSGPKNELSTAIRADGKAVSMFLSSGVIKEIRLPPKNTESAKTIRFSAEVRTHGEIFIDPKGFIYFETLGNGGQSRIIALRPDGNLHRIYEQHNGVTLYQNIGFLGNDESIFTLSEISEENDCKTTKWIPVLNGRGDR